MGVVEDVLVHAGLREVRADIQKTNEEISTIRGNWEATTIKLQGLDSEVEKVRAQLHTTNQELTTKMIDDRVRQMKQSGQMEKMKRTPRAYSGFHYFFRWSNLRWNGFRNGWRLFNTGGLVWVTVLH